MITKEKLVTSYFGYWPEFADGKIEKLTYDATRGIELAVHYIDSVKQKSAHIGLRFGSVSDVSLNNLLSEKVIDSLRIIGSEPHGISIDACYGLDGSFKCKDVEVLYVDA